MRASYSQRSARLLSLKSILLVFFGTLILALGSAVFLLPLELVTGGVTGVAILISHPFGSEVISTELLITLLTWSLFFLGLITLGRDFALKTLISSVVYPPAISVFLHLSSDAYLGGLFDLANAEEPALALMTGALFGGLFVGTGCALTFLGGGSTGGVDVLAFLLCRLFPRLRSSAVIFYIDAVTIGMGIFILGDLSLSLLGILSAFVSATVIDRIFVGSGGAFSAEIVTEHAEEICRAVIEELGRTVTVVDARGGYSAEKKTLLLLSFDTTEYAQLTELLYRIDKGAFVTVHRAHEIGGEGWGQAEHP